MGYFKLLFLMLFCAGCSGSSLHDIFTATKPQEQKCGISQVLDGKIVGGNNTKIENYPWYAALTTDANSAHLNVNCGATLFTPNRLITAAHCYNYANQRSLETYYKVVFNMMNRCQSEGKRIENVLKVIIHRKYDANSQPPANDIAIIVLQNSVPNMPVCLPSRGSYADSIAIVVGYGSTKVRSLDKSSVSEGDLTRAQATYPCQLQEAKIKIFSAKDCGKSGIAHNLAMKTICAGKMEGGVDTCDGDSGGPMVVKVNGKYELVGVVSYGEGCGRPNKPGVYTDATKKGHGDWINENGGGSGSQQSNPSPERPNFPPWPPRRPSIHFSNDDFPHFKPSSPFFEDDFFRQDEEEFPFRL